MKAHIPATRTRFVQPGKIEIDANERAVIGKRNAAFSFAPHSILSLTICRGKSVMKRIEFKYHPNLYSDEILIHEEGICNCCGKKVSEYIGMAYSPEETDEQIMRKEL